MRLLFFLCWRGGAGARPQGLPACEGMVCRLSPVCAALRAGVAMSRRLRRFRHSLLSGEGVLLSLRLFSEDALSTSPLSPPRHRSARHGGVNRGHEVSDLSHLSSSLFCHLISPVYCIHSADQFRLSYSYLNS